MVVTRGLRARAALGRAGIGRRKAEGDGSTPAGRFRLVAVFYRADRVPRPRTALPIAAIRPDLGWCDDPADRNYNRPVRLPYAGRHERLWRNDRLYDVVVVLDFNLARPRPGAGSAIFLHVASPDLAPTEGCIAVGAIDLRRLLSRIRLDTIVDVV
jgi:L,D-peptidoglycan transpeptidase YkuD (ErfK/YbiS/YcfS/YnhG family)